tara:strand:- start:554 stop:874 length:321 start_codon:yes stop_codon:yes gene_type:complete
MIGPKAQIALRNDGIRTGFPSHPDAVCVLTRGVALMPSEDVAKLYAKMLVFDTFTEANDPYGEHDFGKIEQDGTDFFWKIDDHGTNYTQHGLPKRFVLTIMRADEY